MGFRADVRAACVTLLTDYAASASTRLQVYPGRPKSVNPPTAFLDLLPVAVEYVGPQLVQKRPNAKITILHGTYDSKDTVDQADAFVDGFVDYVSARPHAAGANTTIGVSKVEDIPVYVPDWYPANQPPAMTFYATEITLEGYAEG